MFDKFAIIASNPSVVVVEKGLMVKENLHTKVLAIRA
jgi:hypothetical protein